MATQFKQLVDRLDAIHDSLREVNGRLDATRKWYIFDRYGKKVSEGFNSQAEAERSQRRDFAPDERTYVRQDDAVEYDGRLDGYDPPADKNSKVGETKIIRFVEAEGEQLSAEASARPRRSLAASGTHRALARSAATPGM